MRDKSTMKKTQVVKGTKSWNRGWRCCSFGGDVDPPRVGETEPPETSPAPTQGIATLPEDAPLRAIEDEHITQTLAQHEGNRSSAAEALGIDRRSLHRRLSGR
jgi:DNA-binding NtrC family response regulator